VRKNVQQHMPGGNTEQLRPAGLDRSRGLCRDVRGDWLQGPGRRPAAGNRLPERVSGFKWNLRGTRDPSRRSGRPVRRARRDLSPVRLLDR